MRKCYAAAPVGIPTVAVAAVAPLVILAATGPPLLLAIIALLSILAIVAPPARTGTRAPFWPPRLMRGVMPPPATAPIIRVTAMPPARTGTRAPHWPPHLMQGEG
jgi:hypothetical protein